MSLFVGKFLVALREGTSPFLPAKDSLCTKSPGPGPQGCLCILFKGIHFSWLKYTMTTDSETYSGIRMNWNTRSILDPTGCVHRHCQKDVPRNIHGSSPITSYNWSRGNILLIDWKKEKWSESEQGRRLVAVWRKQWHFRGRIHKMYKTDWRSKYVQ